MMDPETHLARLADFLVEDVLAMTDEEILLEDFENGVNTAEVADRMRAEIDAVVRRAHHP